LGSTTQSNNPQGPEGARERARRSASAGGRVLRALGSRLAPKSRFSMAEDAEPRTEVVDAIQSAAGPAAPAFPRRLRSRRRPTNVMAPRQGRREISIVLVNKRAVFLSPLPVGTDQRLLSTSTKFFPTLIVRHHVPRAPSLFPTRRPRFSRRGWRPGATAASSPSASWPGGNRAWWREQRAYGATRPRALAVR